MAQTVIVVIAVAGVTVLAGHTPGENGAAHVSLDGGIMMAAMMLPLSAITVPLVMQRSLRSRRVVALGEHAAGYALVWFAFGAVVTAVMQIGLTRLSEMWLFAVAVVGAVTWQLSATRTQYVERCGRVICAAPSGLRADVGNLVAGCHQGLLCLRTCSPAMVLLATAPHAAVMGVLWAINLTEWAPGPNPFGRHRRYRPAIAYVIVAAAAVVVTTAG